MLSSGRSGTSYLTHLIRSNTHCVARHEPYLDIGNPTLFGRPIHHGLTDQSELLELLQKKRSWIERHGRPNYFEANHALVKAAHELLATCFPEAWYLHVVRNPPEVAKSEANREELLDQWRFPGRRYRSDEGDRLLRWALTGEEDIYRCFGEGSLSRFQWYVVQWIEIENRIARLLNRENIRRRCFFLDMPSDLGDEEKLQSMLTFFAFERRARGERSGLSFPSRRNRTPRRPTIITEHDRRQFHAVVECLPRAHLRIFSGPPYDKLGWRHLLPSLA